VDEVEWAHNNTKIGGRLDDESQCTTSEGCDSDGEDGPPTRQHLLEDEVMEQTTAVIEVLHPTLNAKVPEGRIRQQLIRLLTRTYKLLATMLKDAATKHRNRKKVKQQAAPPVLRSKAVAMVHATLQQLTPAANDFISFVQTRKEPGDEEGDEPKKKRKRAVKQPKQPELKMVPELVHQMEGFDVLVIQLSKLMGGTKKGKKGRELLKHMRRSVARDFRILGDRFGPEEDQDEDQDEDQGQARADQRKKAKQGKKNDSRRCAEEPDGENREVVAENEEAVAENEVMEEESEEERGEAMDNGEAAEKEGDLQYAESEVY